MVARSQGDKRGDKLVVLAIPVDRQEPCGRELQRVRHRHGRRVQHLQRRQQHLLLIQAQAVINAEFRLDVLDGLPMATVQEGALL